MPPQPPPMDVPRDGDPMPDPALVVLVGPSGSGKSTWARSRYRAAEIVSSDDLRAVVGSGRHDLEASVEAFDLLDRIVAARLRRGLTTVVDTLGLEPQRRRALLDAGRAAGLPAVVVSFSTDPEESRRRNRERDVPVPARVLSDQFRLHREVARALPGEGWDRVVMVDTGPAGTDATPAASAPVRAAAPAPGSSGLDVVLQVSRFPWGEDPWSGCARSHSRRTRPASRAWPSWTTSSRSRRSAASGSRSRSPG